MIRKEDLLQIARFKGLAPRLAELDYFQDIALLNIAREFGNKLIFKGGTCLYKAYKLNRFSEDLDFTAAKGFKEAMLYRLPSFFNLLNIQSKMKVESFTKSINIYLEVLGPLYEGRKESIARIIFNISRRERVLLPINRFSHAPLYQEIRPFDLFIMDENEILAEKVRAIHERNKARDVYDLWHLLKRRLLPFNFKLVNKKLSSIGLKFEKAGFAAKLKEKEAGWKRDLAALISGELPPFEQVSKEIMQCLN